MIKNLSKLVDLFIQEKEIIFINEEVDPYLEIAEIHRRVIASGGPALFFSNVKGSSFPVVTNLFGSQNRIQLSFGKNPELFVQDIVSFLQKPRFNWSLIKRGLKVGFKKKKESFELLSSLRELPLLTSWPEDGGPFITWPTIYTEPPGGGTGNLGVYRVQRFDDKTTGLHFQIGKGAGFHYYAAEKVNQPLPVAIIVGGPPSLIMAGVAPLPENIPELLLASLLQGEKMALCKPEGSPYRLPAEADFLLLGEARPHERRLEGPFGDHYGYYSLEHEFPVFHCQKILHKKGAIYPATVVGKPRQEDYFLGNYLQELLKPVIHMVMPNVKDIWSYAETGFHALTAARVEERYYRESMSAAFRILGEGQLSLTKFLLLTDQPVDLRNFKETLKVVLARFKPETDLFIFANLSLDTLDYAGPALNKGSRGVMLGIGEPVRKLPIEYRGPRKARVFCPGCLVIEGEPVVDASLAAWPLVILVDDADKTVASEANFLWTAFTRFDPASDIYTSSQKVINNHIVFTGPVLIDARMKPSYPKEVLVDEATEKLVSERWSSYFPSHNVFMGDSRCADVY
ncbi:MAG: UbiD family decarboxylase [Chlamydiae bacterium]|nr:UbiD family decarboxylase [Chlamydiota bacterium]